MSMHLQRAARRWRPWRLGAALAVSLSAPSLVGCSGDLGDPGDGEDGVASSGTSSEAGAPGSTAAGPNLGVEPGGDAPPLDHPPIDPSALPQPSSVVKRVSLSQLRASLPILFGNESDGTTPITWIMPSGAPGLDAMAGSLGEPDYIEITEESLEPSPMYAKLMDDLARDVCDRALEADVARTASDDRVIVRRVALDATSATDAAGVDDNVRYLLVRLHGVRAPDGDDTEIAPWRGVFDAAVAEADDAGLDAASASVEGWRAVCVGLVVAPDFHLY